MKASVDLKNASNSVQVDTETKTIKAMIGISRTGNADITQSGDITNAKWSKQFNEIKSMYKNLTGKDMGTGNDKGTYWNQFQKLKGQLNRMECDLFIKGSLSAAGYMEFIYETGEIKFKEGGVIKEAKLGANFKYPIAGNFIYMTFGLEGSETGTITAKLDSNSQMILEYSLTVGLKASASVVGEIPYILRAECGIDAKISATLSNSEDPLVVKMTGNIFLKAVALKTWELFNENIPYLDYQLYPKQATYSTRALNYYSIMSDESTDSYNETLDNAQELSRDYLNTQAVYSRTVSDYIYEQNSAYPYNNSRITDIGNGRMLLVFVTDECKSLYEKF